MLMKSESSKWSWMAQMRANLCHCQGFKWLICWLLLVQFHRCSEFPDRFENKQKKVNFNLIYEKIPQRLLWLADLFKHRWSRATSTGTANHDNFLFIIVIFSIDTLTRWSNRSIGWVTNLRVWMDWHLKWLLCPLTLKINK